ncbi:MAG: NAD(P)/FAD-dependent oxidoreductase, partial [Alphaproteobacteria bacterium]|nr:NAD(P)/FAD-dependent oxidoreductase [Alphaproteobacteria bacterium]
MADDFDMIVIGAGPGGYVCAIRAAQLGFKVACIDKRGVPGGTCLNVGCIPSKALLHASHLAQTMRGGQSMGISAGAIKVDIGRLQDYKKIGVEANVQGVQYLFKKNNIEEIVGVARLLSPTQIEVTPLNCANPPRPLTAKHIVIATGSEIAPLKGVAIDEDNIVSSTGALEFDEVPKHLVIVGAGIIGLELGSVWQRLGAQVSVIEYLDRIAPGLDSDIAKAFQRILAKQGINFRLGQKVVAAKSLKSSVKLEIESVHDSG